MPAFITNGPDIPEELLQAHEEGRVVFFCGAGISTPAGLPLFKGLVDNVYTKLGTSRSSVESKSYDKEQYDATIDQLERRYPGQRLAVRSKLLEILKPKWRRKGATTTHQALLQLAMDRKGAVRLVTTNFDRIFHRIIQNKKLDIPTFAAPLLPIPKPSRWHGVVHLHGLLPGRSDDTALNRLVLSSGDFGLAYLTERWAARFVSELFRYYTVCFVGYGINDPVLRYMMDALAADELLGEAKAEAYAFASFENGDEATTIEEWKAKGVIPLLYNVPTGTDDHSALHRTLCEWGDTYRDGVRGKEMIVAAHATSVPLASSRTDFVVGRVLWALTDSLAAKHFADLNPVPPLEWIGPLSERQFKHNDLSRFGVEPDEVIDKRLVFSMLQRPAPYSKSPFMELVNTGCKNSSWDDVMFHLARWLMRHLGDPALILWIAHNGGKVHEKLAMLIRNRLEEIDKLKDESNDSELEIIHENSPKSIPNNFIRVLWRFILSGRLQSGIDNLDFYDWIRRFKKDGLSVNLKLELREILTPRVIFKKPFLWHGEEDKNERIKDYVDWELVLSCDHVHVALKELKDNSDWQDSISDLLQDVVILLHDVLELKSELGGANDKSDMSYVEQPSIEEHPQNKSYHEWTVLIDLVRDAWMAMSNIYPEKAKLYALSWLKVPYPLFKRLAFFAATTTNVFSPDEALDFLFQDDGWWIWSVETEHEALQVIKNISPKLSKKRLSVIEELILDGPPRVMFKDDLENDYWARIVDKEVWLRLSKMNEAGAYLRKRSKDKIIEISARYPEWKLSDDGKDEFPVWSGFGDDWHEFVTAPRRRRELMEWLKVSKKDFWESDDWRQRCRDDFPTTSCALCGLAMQNEWPISRWREALQAWSEDKLLRPSWRYMAKIIYTAPNNVLEELSGALSQWLKEESKSIDSQEDVFFIIVNRIIGFEYAERDNDNDDSVFKAINHPIGQVTEAVINLWYRNDPEAGEGLRGDIRRIFTELCDIEIERFRHGRVVLAAHSISLYRVDREWSNINLLPLFDWDVSNDDAIAVWEGFLWSPRLYRPFLTAIKKSLLETANHLEEIGEHAKQYTSFFTFAALDPGDTFTIEELADATNNLSDNGLLHAARALTRAIGGAGEQRVEYWRNRILPYFKSVWPKDLERVTPELSSQIAVLCISTKGAFSEALNELKYWLKPVEYPGSIINQLHASNICGEFPGDSLLLLDLIVGDDIRWVPGGLQNCLNTIDESNHALSKDRRFVRLNNICKRG